MTDKIAQVRPESSSLGRDVSRQSDSPSRTAAEKIGLILDRPPEVASENLRGDTRLTRRWAHGELHDYLPGLTSHVVMTYYGAERDIAFRRGSKRYASRTREGAITVIPSGSDGRWDISGSIEVSHVYLPEHRLRECAETLTGKPFELLDRVGFEDPTAARIMDILSHEASSASSSSDLFLEQTVDLLCAQLVRAHSSHGALADPQPRRGLANWQVKRVTEFMLGRLDQNINLNEMADLIKLSRFHFCTAFRQATGKTPYDWFLQERMTQARKLLANPVASVTDVGLSVGYNTPSAFAASFRKVVGVTPTDYRRSL